MNKSNYDILRVLKESQYINQRNLAEESGYSLGVVNRALKELFQHGYVDEQMQLTLKAKIEIEQKAPQRAIILAAGYGMRTTPINTETPKALIEIKGERIIERLIKQLISVDIREIYVVVGFMKERFEYLIDQYGVKLIVNAEYSVKNNLYSVMLSQKYLSNSYIIPCDLWCRENPFCKNEFYSWYMVSRETNCESRVRVNRKGEVVMIKENSEGNVMIGICYLLRQDAEVIRSRIQELCSQRCNDGAFWEEALFKNDRMIIPAKMMEVNDIVEINTYEQLREFDNNSNQLKNNAIQIICRVLETQTKNIKNIRVLKKGMTNRSFLFECKGKRYIMRIPGEGTKRLIRREQEAAVYHAIEGMNIADNIVYIDPKCGYKITEYWEEARVCDPLNVKDLEQCMSCLRRFHELKLKVDYEFDLFRQICFYEELLGEGKSVFHDYKETKKNIFSLRKYIEEHVEEKVLTHIDAVPDNFLFIWQGKEEEVRLIDWEYAGMQDPHVDIAMFCIYSFYDKNQIDSLIDIYFRGECSLAIRIKIYCYIAVCGLLWSNWCEYKQLLGVEFGEYSIRQYRYAKDFYRIAQREIEGNGEKENV